MIVVDYLLRIFMNYKIHKICKKYKIKNYTIKDGLVNVDGSVDLHYKGLTELPLKFGAVSGHFICSSNHLLNLHNSPTHVGLDFSCSHNLLTSLEGSPTYVGGDFYCGINQLTDFKGCPDVVENGFYCSENRIHSLDGLLFKRVEIRRIACNTISDLYHKYNLVDIDHREFLIEADVIRPPDEIGGLPIINKARMDWFTQTYGLEEFKVDKNYKLQL